MQSASPTVQAAIQATLPYVSEHIDKARQFAFGGTDINEQDLPRISKSVGKVRDIYYGDELVVLISTDRQSAFDRQIARVPFKGQVLNLASQWWFKEAKEKIGIPNAVVSVVSSASFCTWIVFVFVVVLCVFFFSPFF
jgi:hypothetical protein